MIKPFLACIDMFAPGTPSSMLLGVPECSHGGAFERHNFRNWHERFSGNTELGVRGAARKNRSATWSVRILVSQFIVFGCEIVSVYCLIFERSPWRHLLFRAHVLSLVDPSPFTMPRALPWMSVDEKRLVGNHRGRRRPL